MSKEVDTIITETSEELLFKYEDISNFMSECFIRTLVSKGKTPSETQARAIITGAIFENWLQISAKNKLQVSCFRSTSMYG